MARQTRAQRRARRVEQQQSGGGFAQRARARQQQVRPSQQPAKSQAGTQRRERGGARSFVAESWGELKKVEWPGQPQVIQATIVVLIACIVVGIYLYANDQLWKPVVQKIIGQ